MSKDLQSALSEAIAEKSAFKLWSAADIKAHQDTIATSGKALMTMIRDNGNQCLAHFKAHGDITLAERLLASLPNGVVVAGLAKWLQSHAPVKFDRDGKATVTGKPEETKLDEALAKDWVMDTQVQNRAKNPIEPMSPALIKGRIKGYLKQIEKAGETGGRGFVGKTPEEQKATQVACENLINKTILIMDNVDLTSAPVADVVSAVTGQSDRKSRRGQKQAEGEAVAA